MHEQSLKEIYDVYGFETEVTVNGETVSSMEWNPLHYAVYEGKISVVRYYLETVKVDSRLTLTLRNDIFNKDLDEPTSQLSSYSLPQLCFCLILAVSKRDLPMFDYLLNDLKVHLWTTEHLSFILRGLLQEGWIPGIESLILGKTCTALFRTLTYPLQ